MSAAYLRVRVWHNDGEDPTMDFLHVTRIEVLDKDFITSHRHGHYTITPAVTEPYGPKVRA